MLSRPRRNRQSAAALGEGDFPKIEQLEDGGIYAMRLDTALDARPEPFESARVAVLQSWQAQQTVSLLTAQATAQIATLGGEASFEAAGLDATVEIDQNRNAFIDGAPAGFMDEVFGMNVGDVAVLPGEDSVTILRLDGITAAAQDDDRSNALVAQIGEQLNQTLAQDLYGIFADEVVSRAGPQIDQRALQAVHVNFP